MKVTVENTVSIKSFYQKWADDELMSIIRVISECESEQELRDVLPVFWKYDKTWRMKSDGHHICHFVFGFGAHHLWVKQCEFTTGNVFGERILFVEF